MPSRTQRDRDGDVRRMRVRRGVVGCVDGVGPRCDLRDALAERGDVAAVDRRRLSGENRALAVLDEVPQPAHLGSSASGRRSQPTGRSLSRPVSRLTHDDVPCRRLSTGGRSCSKCGPPGGGKQGQGAGAVLRLHPDAAHLGLHLAVAVLADAAAGPVSQRLGTRHRARHSRVVEHALAAHPTAEDRLLDGVLDEGDDSHCGLRRGPRARRCSRSSFARFVALAASGA